MTVKYWSKRGYKMILLESPIDSKWNFSFNVKNAKLVVKHIDEIKKFVYG